MLKKEKRHLVPSSISLILREGPPAWETTLSEEWKHCTVRNPSEPLTEVTEWLLFYNSEVQQEKTEINTIEYFRILEKKKI